MPRPSAQHTALFNQVGKLLWGDQFRMQAARQLEMSLSSINRFSGGLYGPPPHVWKKLRSFLEKHQSECARALSKLPNDGDDE